MKKFLMFVGIAFMSATSFSQVYFSCDYREECDWNNDKEKFENCEKWEDFSMFRLNADASMFTHTTEKLKSVYYVESNAYDEENDVYTYDVISDVGNKYFWIIDLNNSEIRLLPTDKDVIYMVRFYVKRSWTEEEGE
jgi:hypothetical protein